MNPRLKQDQKAIYLACSSSILKRYRKIVKMLSPYKISPEK